MIDPIPCIEERIKIGELQEENNRLKERIKELEQLLCEKFRLKKLFIIFMSI